MDDTSQRLLYKIAKRLDNFTPTPPTPPTPPVPVIVQWAPATELVSWVDGSGPHNNKDLAEFQAIADYPTVTVMSFIGTGLLTSLTGLSALPALGALTVNNNSLTSLDVSGLTALYYLDCSFNLVASLTVTGCSALVQLYCNSNSLTGLSLVGCAALQVLDCSINSLTTLDVTPAAVSLLTLNCFNNATLGTLIVTGCTSLTDLDAGLTAITTLTGLLDCSSLVVLILVATQIASVDVHGLVNLFSADISQCPNLTAADAHGCSALDSIALDGCPNLLTVDLHDCTVLQGFDLTSGNGLVQSLNMANCTTAINISCQNNQISALAVTNCSSLVSLVFNDNLLLTAVVDAVLSEVVAAALANAGGMNIGGTNQAPTGGCANADIVTLKANGWSIAECP